MRILSRAWSPWASGSERRNDLGCTAELVADTPWEGVCAMAEGVADGTCIGSGMIDVQEV